MRGRSVVGRRSGGLVKAVMAVALIASFSVVRDAGAWAEPRLDPYEPRSAVLTSKTSDQVTILVGGLRSDFHLQPAAQVLMMGSGFDLDSWGAFLYNPGGAPDGLLTWSVSKGKI